MNVCSHCGIGTLHESVEGSTLTITCDHCGYSIARTKMNPIYEDRTAYSLYLAKGNTTSKDSLRAVSRVAGCNYLAAKKLFATDNPLIFAGKAPEVLEKIRLLHDAGVRTRVEPEFPYPL